MPNPAIESVRFEDDVAREILAGGDIGSLPRDYPLDRMAADRMKELADARGRVADLEAVIADALRHADSHGMALWPVFKALRKSVCKGK